MHDNYCRGASLLTSATEFHNITGNQADKGDYEQVAPSKPACIAFMSWCSAECRRFGPLFDDIAAEFPHARFYRLDVEHEESARLALEQGVTREAQLPVFKFYRNGFEITPHVEGAHVDELRAALQRLTV